MGQDKSSQVTGSTTSSDKAGGGKNISALLKRLKGKINKKSGEQGSLHQSANTPPSSGKVSSVGTSDTGVPVSNKQAPFVGKVAQDHLVGNQLSGFTFGNVITDFGAPSPIGFSAPTPEAPVTNIDDE